MICAHEINAEDDKIIQINIILFIDHWDVRIKETIKPYKAKAYPKININIIPTNILSCCALARTPASPTIPIAKPAA